MLYLNDWHHLLYAGRPTTVLSSAEVATYAGDWSAYLLSANIPVDLHPEILYINRMASYKLSHTAYTIVIPDIKDLLHVKSSYGT